LYDKKYLFNITVTFICGLVLGFCVFGFYAGTGRGSDNSAELGKRLEQVNRDFESALGAQREASERAAGLQAELKRITEYAGIIETGTGQLEARAGSIADSFDGIIGQGGKLADGIGRASDSLEESRILLGELGAILLSIQTNR